MGKKSEYGKGEVRGNVPDVPITKLFQGRDAYHHHRAGRLKRNITNIVGVLNQSLTQ